LEPQKVGRRVRKELCPYFEDSSWHHLSGSEKKRKSKVKTQKAKVKSGRNIGFAF
jgi:hypothetical protein